MFVFILTDKCSLHSSSKIILFETEDTNYRKPQSIKIRDVETSPNVYTYKTLIHLRHKEHYRRVSRGVIRAKRSGVLL